MTKLTDKTLGEAAGNGDGTYRLNDVARWLFEATTGKPMSKEEADGLIAEAMAKRAARK